MGYHPCAGQRRALRSYHTQYKNVNCQGWTKQGTYSGSTSHQSYTVSSSSSQNYRYCSSTGECSRPCDGVHLTVSSSPSSPLWHPSTSAHALSKSCNVPLEPRFGIVRFMERVSTNQNCSIQVVSSTRSRIISFSFCLYIQLWGCSLAGRRRCWLFWCLLSVFGMLFIFKVQMLSRLLIWLL